MLALVTALTTTASASSRQRQSEPTAALRRLKEQRRDGRRDGCSVIEEVVRDRGHRVVLLVRSSTEFVPLRASAMPGRPGRARRPRSYMPEPGAPSFDRDSADVEVGLAELCCLDRCVVRDCSASCGSSTRSRLGSGAGAHRAAQYPVGGCRGHDRPSHGVLDPAAYEPDVDRVGAEQS
jgi:hypothetical protein